MSRKLAAIKTPIYTFVVCVVLILISGCAPDPGLSGNSDTLITEEIEAAWWYFEPDSELPPEERPVIKISPTAIRGVGYCNGFGMDVAIDSSGTIEVLRLTSQMVGCDDRGEAEATFFRRLTTATHFRLNPTDEIILSTPEGDLVFRNYAGYMNDWRLNPPDEPILVPQVQPSPYPIPIESTVPPPLPESPYP